jgi:polar amino acid transport system substrate-binding protein
MTNYPCRIGALIKSYRYITALISILALIVVAGVVGVWLHTHQVEDQAWQRIQSSGVLRVGMDASYPPFEDVDADGQIVGFDVDLAREIGRRLGLEVSFANIPYDGLYDALLVGQVDVLISALVAAPEFEGKANFSLPYFNAGDYLVVPVDSSVEHITDLTGHILAVEYGSSGDVQARQWERRLSALTIQRYSDPELALQAVISREADAALVDGITARLGVGHFPELMLGPSVTDAFFAVAVPEESNLLLEKMNETIEALADDGTLSQLIAKWFGL